MAFDWKKYTPLHPFCLMFSVPSKWPSYVCNNHGRVCLFSTMGGFVSSHACLTLYLGFSLILSSLSTPKLYLLSCTPFIHWGFFACFACVLTFLLMYVSSGIPCVIPSFLHYLCFHYLFSRTQYYLAQFPQSIRAYTSYAFPCRWIAYSCL